MPQTKSMKNEQGQTMAELALVLPALCLILLAILQCGIVFKNYVTLTVAARAGARKAAVSRHLSDPAGACKAAVLAAADNLNKTDLQTNLSCSSAWTPGSDVTVFADYKYDINLLGWVVWSGRMKSQMKERVE
jgi:Flp pilus assembly protein TadG